jgi:hypothetical protein
MSFQYETETFLASEARFTFVSHLCNICNKILDSVVKKEHLNFFIFKHTETSYFSTNACQIGNRLFGAHAPKL